MAGKDHVQMILCKVDFLKKISVYLISVYLISVYLRLLTTSYFFSSKGTPQSFDEKTKLSHQNDSTNSADEINSKFDPLSKTI